MMETKTKYTDIKEGQRLVFKNSMHCGRLELIIDFDKLDKKGNALIDVHDGHTTRLCDLQIRKYKRFHQYIGIYNFGNRARGRRTHLKMEIPNNYEFLVVE